MNNIKDMILPTLDQVENCGNIVWEHLKNGVRDFIKE